MSFQAMAWAIQQRTGSPTAKWLLLVLCNYADNEGTCWPSQQTLADDTEMTDRTIRSALGILVERGLVAVEHRPGTGAGRKTNVYRISLPENSSERRDGNRKILQGQPEAEWGQPENSSDKPIIEPIKEEPVTEKSKRTPRAALMSVLSEDMAEALIEARKALKSPLTGRAAEQLAKRLGEYHDPEAGASRMLERGWKGFNPDWMQDQPRQRQQNHDRRSELLDALDGPALRTIDGEFSADEPPQRLRLVSPGIG